MRAKTVTTLIALPLALAAGLALAQSAGSVRTLRGAAVDEQVAVQPQHHQDEQRFKRNYRQQPPLIPHGISHYQIDKDVNRCLSCHDWSVAGDRGAPTLSMTHYMDRDGRQLDRVAGGRWFCTQCHVPQADAPELVGNDFAPSSR